MIHINGDGEETLTLPLPFPLLSSINNRDKSNIVKFRKKKTCIILQEKTARPRERSYTKKHAANNLDSLPPLSADPTYTITINLH
jgi:hypothetical protein